MRRHHNTAKPANESITMATTSNQTNISFDQEAADHPYTAYEKQPEPEPYAVLNQTNVSPSSHQQSANHPYTAYQKQPEPEPYAALNQMPLSNPTAMASDPDYQNVNEYEDNLNIEIN